MKTLYCTYFSKQSFTHHIESDKNKTLDNRTKTAGGGTVAKRAERSEAKKSNGHSRRRAVNKDGFFLTDMGKQLKLL